MGVESIHVPRWRGLWEPGTAYRISDLVADRGRSFAAKLTHTAAAANRPPDADEGNDTWALFAARGNPGAPGPRGLPGNDGRNGLNGADGNGYEYIYARSARTVTALRSAISRR